MLQAEGPDIVRAERRSRLEVDRDADLFTQEFGEGPSLVTLRDRLPYLEELGVTNLHLLPIFATSGDGGYVAFDGSTGGRRDRVLGPAAMAQLFGWGLAGLCPGPALTGLGLGRIEIVIFVIAMLAGMGAFRLAETTVLRPA